jgi:phosphonatase-like hydrolase
MIRLVVFDMAGTTVDEDNVVYKTLRRAINENGYDFSLDQVLEQGAGKEKLQAIKSILKKFAKVEDDKTSDFIYRKFIVYLDQAYKDLKVLPQPNAVKLFSILKQKKIFVVLNTGYNQETAEGLIRKMNWEKGVEFDDLVTASEVTRNRPDPDMILLAMHKTGIHDPKEVIKVGDSIIDIEEGGNAGCKLNIGITTGAHTYQQLQSAGPDYIINNLLELVPIIEKANA